MKLSDMFGKPKTLAKAPAAQKAAGVYLNPSPVTPAPQTSALAQTIRKPGPIPVNWPKARFQGRKDYKAILTRKELEDYLRRCEETGFGSFDWETAASEEERLRFQQIEEPTKEQRDAYLKSPLDPWRGEICTVSLCAAPDEARVVPISHKKGKVFEPSLTRTEARELLLDTLDRMLFQNPKIMKIAVNLEFETKFSAKYARYIMMPVADPLIMWVRCMQISAPERIKDPKRPAAGWGLKPMTKYLFGVNMNDFSKLLEKHGVEFFDEIDASQGEGLLYSAEDSDYGLQHYLYWLEVAKQIPKYDEWLHKIEMPFARVIGLMEYHGMPWDSDLANVKRQEAEALQQQAAEDIKRLAWEACGVEVDTGKTGKTNSVKGLLFDVMKVPPAKLSEKTSDPSLDEEAIIDMKFMLEHKLLKLEEEAFLGVELPEDWEEIAVPLELPGTVTARYNVGPEYTRWHNLDKAQRKAIEIKRRQDHPYKDAAIQLLDLIQKIQTAGTLLSSHINGRDKWVNPVSKRIHANYSPWTETARLNSSSPNQQNTPRPSNDDFGVRNMHVPRPGKVFFLIDFAGFELRILAWRSGDEVMIDIFINNGDMHRKTASAITGKPEEEVTKKERTDAKPANFGIAYGGTEHALQTQFKTEYGMRRTLAECLVMVNGVKRAYPRVPEFQREIALDAREKGWVETIYGYKRLLPNINNPIGWKRSSDERRASNTPIQGSAADIMKKCQNDVYDEIGRGTAFWRRVELEGADLGDVESWQQYPLAHGKTDMIAQIHDEMIFEMDDDPELIEHAMNWIKATMEQPPIPGFPVPILAEASIAYRWGEKEDADKWLEKRKAQ